MKITFMMPLLLFLSFLIWVVFAMRKMGGRLIIRPTEPTIR